jgi:hypothetical protein
MHLWGAIEWYRKGTTSVYSCGDTYESLDWHQDNELPKPTEVDLEIAWSQAQKDYKAKEYQRQRQKEYPPIEAQLDIMYNFGFTEWLKHIHTIKKKYPSSREIKEPNLVNHMDVMNDRVTKVENSTSLELQNTKAELMAIQAAVMETKGAIQAIKGFMMEIPNIQKSLQDLHNQLGNKNAIS